MNPNAYQPGDPRLVKEIVDNIKSRGVFDEIRKDCLADVDTKPAYQNLKGRVDNFVNRYLSREQWSPNLNKNQLRNALRKEIMESGMLASGVDRIIEQVVNPKVYKEFKPVIEKIICEHLGIDVEQRRERERKQMEILQKIQQRDRGETPGEAVLESGDGYDLNNGFTQPPPPITRPQTPPNSALSSANVSTTSMMLNGMPPTNSLPMNALPPNNLPMNTPPLPHNNMPMNNTLPPNSLPMGVMPPNSLPITAPLPNSIPMNTLPPNSLAPNALRPNQPPPGMPMIPTSQPQGLVYPPAQPMINPAQTAPLPNGQPPPGLPPNLQPGMVPPMMRPRLPGQMQLPAQMPPGMPVHQFIPGMPMPMQPMMRPPFINPQLLQQQQAALAEMAKYAPLGTQFPPLPPSMRDTTPVTPVAQPTSAPSLSTPPVSISKPEPAVAAKGEQDDSPKSESPDPLYPPGTTPPRPTTTSSPRVPSPRGSPESMEMSDSSDSDSPPPDLDSEDDEEPLKIDMAFDPNASFLTLLTSPRGAGSAISDFKLGLKEEVIKEEPTQTNESNKGGVTSDYSDKSEQSSSEKERKTSSDRSHEYSGKGSKRVQFSDRKNESNSEKSAEKKNQGTVKSVKSSDAKSSRDDKKSDRSSSDKSRSHDKSRSSDKSKSDNKDKSRSSDVKRDNKDKSIKDTDHSDRNSNKSSSAKDKISSTKHKSSSSGTTSSSTSHRSSSSKSSDSSKSQSHKSSSRDVKSDKHSSSSSSGKSQSSSEKSKDPRLSSKSDSPSKFEHKKSSRDMDDSRKERSSPKIDGVSRSKTESERDVPMMMADDVDATMETVKDEPKKYTFAWDNLDEEVSSDSDVSSVNTSDLSSDYQISDLDDDDDEVDVEALDDNDEQRVRPLTKTKVKKTKEERKAELHAQKVQERQSLRRKRKNTKYLGDFEGFLSSEDEEEDDEDEKEEEDDEQGGSSRKRRRPDSRSSTPVDGPAKKKLKQLGTSFAKARKIVRGGKIVVSARPAPVSMTEQALASRPRMPRRTCIPSGLRPTPLAVPGFNLLLSRRFSFIPVDKKGRAKANVSRAWSGKASSRSSSPVTSGRATPVSGKGARDSPLLAASRFLTGSPLSAAGSPDIRGSPIIASGHIVEDRDTPLSERSESANLPETVIIKTEVEVLTDQEETQMDYSDIKTELLPIKSEEKFEPKIEPDDVQISTTNVVKCENESIEPDVDIDKSVVESVSEEKKENNAIDLNSGIHVSTQEVENSSVEEKPSETKDDHIENKDDHIENISEPLSEKFDKEKTLAEIVPASGEDQATAEGRDTAADVDICVSEDSDSEEKMVIDESADAEKVDDDAASASAAVDMLEEDKKTTDVVVERDVQTSVADDASALAVNDNVKIMNENEQLKGGTEDQKLRPSDNATDELKESIDEDVSLPDNESKSTESEAATGGTVLSDDLKEKEESEPVNERDTKAPVDITASETSEVDDAMPTDFRSSGTDITTNIDSARQSPLQHDSPPRESLPRVGPPSPGTEEPFSPQEHCMPKVGISSPTDGNAISPVSARQSTSPRTSNRGPSPDSRPESPAVRRTRKPNKRFLETETEKPTKTRPRRGSNEPKELDSSKTVIEERTTRTRTRSGRSTPGVADTLVETTDVSSKLEVRGRSRNVSDASDKTTDSSESRSRGGKTPDSAELPADVRSRKRKGSGSSGRQTPEASKSGESSRSNSPPRRVSRRQHHEKRIWSPEPDTPRGKRQAAPTTTKQPPAKRSKH